MAAIQSGSLIFKFISFLPLMKMSLPDHQQQLVFFSVENEIDKFYRIRTRCKSVAAFVSVRVMISKSFDVKSVAWTEERTRMRINRKDKPKESKKRMSKSQLWRKFEYLHIFHIQMQFKMNHSNDTNENKE